MTPTNARALLSDDFLTEARAHGPSGGEDMSGARVGLPDDGHVGRDDGDEGGLRYRTIWVSDIHLGTRGCKADMLLDFFKHAESDTLYLVGDIVDGWRLKRTWFWAQSHNDVVQKVLRKARKGTRVIYVPGNHDEALRDYTGHHFGGVEVVAEAIHTMVDGRRFLVIHGDAFDGVVRYAKWLAVLGDSAYTVLLAANHWVNIARRRLGYPYWSLSAFLKHKVKNAVEYISNYEQALADEARRRHVDGVICGHIHNAEIRDMDGILYCNDGDWVESCSALVEHLDGRLEIVRWADLMAARSSEGQFAQKAIAHAGTAS